MPGTALNDLHQKLLATFEIEHRDHVDQIRSLLVLMAKTSAPPAGPEFEEIFRRAHSLKGAARAVELKPIEELAHRLETLFSRVRRGECAFDEQVARVTQQVLDASEDCMSALTAGGPAPTGDAESVAAALRAIGGVAGIAEPVPEAPFPAPSFQAREMVRISAENFDGLFRTAGSLAGETQREDGVAQALDELLRNISRIENASRMAAALTPGAANLPECIDAIERQTRAVGRQVRAALRLHKSTHWSLSRLGKQLQADVRQARMVPAESLLEGYRKMMRDLARDEGQNEKKQIAFRASCASVHADRRVLDALKDPIMHLLRNAVSHGIEPALARIGKGKKPEGVVTLHVDADGQRLNVTVEDDGAGVDFARVAEVAAGEGVPSGEDTSPGARNSLTRILFRAGFSTSRSVSSLSGRGMGLSVVYEAMRRLQGDLDLQPVPGGGTRITLSVPLSVVSHRLMVVNSGNHTYAIPVPGIERVRRIEPSNVETAGGKPVLVVDGQPLPLAGISALLGLANPSDPAENAPERHAVILRSGSRRIALAVEKVAREVDAVVQDLPYATGCGGKVSAGVILDDGSIAFVVNPMELIQSAFQPRPHAQPFFPPKRPEPAGKPAPEANAAAATILVVDDSMTTRALEKSILEANGYRVRVAVDGIDALASLRRDSANLVISDIEMPNLDGFGLIEAMKRDPALAKIPVIVVSSVERREDQERGLAVGADAYIVKRKFDQQELLSVIRQIV